MSKFLTAAELEEISQHSKRYKDTTALALLDHIAVLNAELAFFNTRVPCSCPTCLSVRTRILAAR